MDSAWWYPDPTNPLVGPMWEPVDLVASEMSEAILMRDGGGMKRLLRYGSMTVQLGDSSVLVAEGQRRYIWLSSPEHEAVVR